MKSLKFLYFICNSFSRSACIFLLSFLLSNISFAQTKDVTQTKDYTQVKTSVKNTKNKNFCGVVTYKISSIDDKFSLSKEEAIRYAASSSVIWNDGLGKKVLEYNEKGMIDIKFVFDQRQIDTIERNILEERAKQKNDELVVSLQEINTRKDRFEKLKADFENDWNNFSNNLKAYNTNISQINASGGLDSLQLQSYDQLRKDLEQKGSGFEVRKNEINNYLDDMNSKVKNYNNLISEVNNIVKQVNSKVTKSFEQGYYQNKKITLYEYSSTSTLTRLIAHELGHALGIGHVKNEKSIMYYLNSATTSQLSKEDISAYAILCPQKK
jgi:predicted Zn-dependent protease